MGSAIHEAGSSMSAELKTSQAGETAMSPPTAEARPRHQLLMSGILEDVFGITDSL